MSSKKPLNFAQALRARPGKAEESVPDSEPSQAKPLLSLSHSTSAAVADKASHNEQDDQTEIEDSVAGHPKNNQEVASHPATQPPSHPATRGPVASHPATQPPIQDKLIEWPATDQKNQELIYKKDYSRMPSRWGKKDATYRINDKTKADFDARYGGQRSAIIEDFITSLLGGQPPSHPIIREWWLATQSPSHPATQPHDLMIDDDDSEERINSPSSVINHQIGGQPPSHPATHEEDEILFFWSKWTRNVIKDSDRVARELVRDVPPAVCKAAILVAFHRAKRKINSFNFFVEEIRFTYETTPEVTDEYCRAAIYAIGRDRGLQFIPEEERGWVEAALKARGKL